VSSKLKKGEKAAKAAKVSKLTSTKSGPKGVRAKSLSKDEPPAPEARRLMRKVLKAFDKLYPEPECGLEVRDPFGLLVSTILSAQCTDARVNQVAPVLLKAYPGPREMASAEIGTLEGLIKSCGFFRMKAKNIKAASQALEDRFKGVVPETLEELVTLPGVGRKTANCVMGNAFGLPGITVDTHLGRVSRRLGLSKHTDPVKVEHDLSLLIPRESWTRFSHQAIAHGRTYCKSQRPLCETCPLTFCEYPKRKEAS
jgi:endonuclease-3